MVLSFFALSNAAESKDGSGDIKLNSAVLNHFMDYMLGVGITDSRDKTKKSGDPIIFAVTPSGAYSSYYFCPAKYNGMCYPANTAIGDAQNDCKKYAKKNGSSERCYIFAIKYKIVWNSINYKIPKKSNFEEIEKMMIDLGFYGQQASKKIEKKEIEKKETKITGDIFPTNAGKTTFKKKTMEDLVYLNNKKRSKSIKEHWNKKYPEYNGYKAWAESPNRAWAWRTSSTSEKDAITQAVDRCNAYEDDYNDPPLCVVTKVGDKHLTYQEQADWMQKIYGRTTLAAKLIGKKKIEKKKKEKKTEKTKTTSSSLSEELKELNKLYEDGVLTKEEFEKAKKKLLN